MSLSVAPFSANNIMPNAKPSLQNSYAKNTMISDKVSFSSSSKIKKPAFLTNLKTKLTGLLPKKPTQGKLPTEQEVQEITEQLQKSFSSGKIKEISWKDFMGEE